MEREGKGGGGGGQAAVPGDYLILGFNPDRPNICLSMGRYS